MKWKTTRETNTKKPHPKPQKINQITNDLTEWKDQGIVWKAAHQQPLNPFSKTDPEVLHHLQKLISPASCFLNLRTQKGILQRRAAVWFRESILRYFIWICALWLLNYFQREWWGQGLYHRGTNGPGFEFCLKEPLTFSPRIFYILSQLHGGVCGTTMALRLPFSCLIAGNRRTVLPILQHEWVTRMTFAKSPTLLHCDKASRQTASWKWRIRCGNFPWCPKEKQTRNNLNSSFKTHKGTREKHLVLLF